MCRHLAYLGPPQPLSRLLLEPAHSLAHQSWAPREMRGGGTINADGFGVGWFPPGGGMPLRYRRDSPIWSDAALPGLAATTVSGAVLAAVRSATAGMPVVETAAAPFADGRWLFSHNGVVTGWPGTVAKLAERLPTTDLLTLEAPTDSALLWALVRDRLRAGEPMAAAVATTVLEVEAAAPGSRLNLLLTDGETVVASTLGHSLHTRATAGSMLVSSEPLDETAPDDSALDTTALDTTALDRTVPGTTVPGTTVPGTTALDEQPGWRPVPDRHLVTATARHLDLTPLGER